MMVLRSIRTYKLVSELEQWVRLDAQVHVIFTSESPRHARIWNGGFAEVLFGRPSFSMLGAVELVRVRLVQFEDGFKTIPRPV